jgi:hypothetical protein
MPVGRSRRLRRERDEQAEGGARRHPLHDSLTSSVGHDDAVAAWRQTPHFEWRAACRCAVDYDARWRIEVTSSCPKVTGPACRRFRKLRCPSTVTVRRRSPASLRSRTSRAPERAPAHRRHAPATPSTMTAAPSGREFNRARSVGDGAAPVEDALPAAAGLRWPRRSRQS